MSVPHEIEKEIRHRMRNLKEELLSRGMVPVLAVSAKICDDGLTGLQLFILEPGSRAAVIEALQYVLKNLMVEEIMEPGGGS